VVWVDKRFWDGGRLLNLSSISISQQLTQAGFVLVFFGLFLVLHALYRRRRPQHGPRRSLDYAGSAELFELLLFRHDTY
jgi:hypothetical protein